MSAPAPPVSIAVEHVPWWRWVARLLGAAACMWFIVDAGGPAAGAWAALLAVTTCMVGEEMGQRRMARVVERAFELAIAMVEADRAKDAAAHRVRGDGEGRG